MGILDFITGGSPEKQLQKQVKRVVNRNAQPEDREAAAYWLADNGSREAILGLLGRFEMSIENQMKDRKEKELVFDLLVELGDRVVEPAREYLERSRNIAYAIRLIGEAAGQAERLETILHLLDLEARKDDFKPDRKRQLLILLAEHRDPRIVESAARFLRDFDEGVRYAAAEAILAQETDDGREPLLRVLADPEEESTRLRARLAEAFANRGWPLGERAEQVAALLPPQWKVVGGRVHPA